MAFSLRRSDLRRRKQTQPDGRISTGVKVIGSHGSMFKNIDLCICFHQTGWLRMVGVAVGVRS